MTRKFKLLAVVPQAGESRAYFFNKAECLLLPIFISDKTVFQLLCAQQSILFDLENNFGGGNSVKESVKLHSPEVVIKAEITIDVRYASKYGMKVTPGLLEKSLSEIS